MTLKIRVLPLLEALLIILVREMKKIESIFDQMSKFHSYLRSPAEIQIFDELYSTSQSHHRGHQKTCTLAQEFNIVFRNYRIKIHSYPRHL